MALRLRRGTDAERQTLTPLEGELIYVTDSRSLYVGDGTTVGGVLIAASGEVSNTLAGLLDTEIVGLQDGDILRYDSATGEWLNSQSALDLDDLINVIFTNKENGDIVQYDGASWVNVPAGQIVGDNVAGLNLDDFNDVFYTGTPVVDNILAHDGNKFTNTPLKDLADRLLSREGTHTITIAADDSTIMVNPNNNRLTGDLYGSVYDDFGNIIIDEFAKSATIDVKDPTNTHIVLDNFTGDLRRGETGDVIIQGGAAPVFIGDLDGNVSGDLFDPNLDKILDAGDRTITNVLLTDSDLKGGSIFADDSTLIFDSISGKLNLNDTVEGDIRTSIVDNVSRIVLTKESDTDLALDTNLYGQLRFDINDANGQKTVAFIAAKHNEFIIGQDTGGTFGSGSNYIVFLENKMGVGTGSPEATLDVAGAIKPAVYADDAARDAAIPSPVAGMMIFNTTGTKFQGYTGAAWVDLN